MTNFFGGVATRKIELADFVSFEKTVETFETEWLQIVATLKAKGRKS